MQGEINKKRRGTEYGVAANAWGENNTGSKSQSSGNLDSRWEG